MGAVAEWMKADTFHSGTYDIWHNLTAEQKASRGKYHTSRAYNIIDHAVDALGSFDPKVHRPRTGNNQRASEAADRVEFALHEILLDAFLQEVMQPAKTAGKYGILYNYMQLYTGIDLTRLIRKPERKNGEDQADFDQRMEDWEEQRAGFNPIRIRAPHPGEVYMDPRDKNPDMAVRRFKMRAFELEDLTLKKKARRLADSSLFDMGTLDPYEEVEVVEFWTPKWHALKRPGQEFTENFFSEPNTWGFQPYIHAFGSGGNIPTNAGGALDPTYLAVGFLHPIMESLRARDQQFTAKQQILMRAAYAKRGTRLDPEEAASQLQGDIISGDESDWWAEKFPNLPNEIFRYGEEIDADIEEGSFNLQVAGFRQSGVDTATQQVILSEASNRKFAVIQSQLGNIFSIAASNILRLAVQLKEIYGINTINVGDNPLRIADIGENYRVFVAFENVDPVVHQQLVAQSSSLVAQGLESKEGHWRTARVEDATGKRLEILMDQVRELPAAKMQALSFAATELGLRKVGQQLQGESDRLKAEQNGGELGDVALQDGSGRPLVTRGGAVPGGPVLPETGR